MLTSPVNSGRPVWMWVRSTESSRCSPPLNMIHRESEFLSGQRGSKPDSGQKLPVVPPSLAIKTTLTPTTSPSLCFPLFTTSQLQKTSAELNLPTLLFLYCCADCWSAIRPLSWLKALAGLLKTQPCAHAVLDEWQRPPKPYEQISPAQYKTKMCLKSLFWQITEHIEEKRSCRKHGSTLVDLKYGCFLRTLPEPCYA